MGWNIGGGVRFTTNDLFDLHNRLQAWRGIMLTLTRKKLNEILVEDIISAVDRDMGRGKEFPKDPLSAAWKALDEAQTEIRKTGYRNPRYDFDFEISILPFEGELYGIVRTEQTEWRNKFMRSGIVKPFFWFDDERPSNVKAADWAERKRVWTKMFDRDSRAIAHGYDTKFTIDLWQLRPFDNPAGFRKRIAAQINKRPFDKRVRSVAKDKVVSERMRADPEYDPSIKGSSNIFHVMFKATDWLKTEEGKAALEAEMAVVEKMLLPQIEGTML